MLSPRMQPTPKVLASAVGARDDADVGECYFATCLDPATVEAIGTYDGVSGVMETVALCLCERHAAAMRDEELVLATCCATSQPPPT